jgi:hypothetical protein
LILVEILIYVNAFSPWLLVSIAALACLAERIVSQVASAKGINSVETKHNHVHRQLSNSSKCSRRTKRYLFRPPDIDCAPLKAADDEKDWFVAAVSSLYDVTYFMVDNGKVGVVTEQQLTIPDKSQKKERDIQKRRRQISALLDKLRTEFEDSALDPGDDCDPIDDGFFARLMVALDFDEEKILKRIDKYRAWRREVRGIVVPPLAWTRMGFMVLPFEDYLGRPVLVVKARWFQKEYEKQPELMEAGIRATVDTAITHQLQRRKTRLSRENPLEQYLLVFEAEGSGWANFSLKVIKIMLREAEEHYPDRLAQCLILRCNHVVKGIWKMVSPLLHPRTRRKVNLVGAKDVNRIMQQYVPIENLPPNYGGTGNSWFDPTDAETIGEYAGNLAEKTWQGLGMELQESTGRIRVTQVSGQDWEVKLVERRNSRQSGDSGSSQVRVTTPHMRLKFISALSPQNTKCCCMGPGVPQEVRSPEAFETYLNRLFVSEHSVERVLKFIRDEPD